MKMGANREMFARLIVQICQRVKPTITILDGILALEGEGPGKRGIPRRLDTIIASRDPFAVDAAACRMLGLQPDAVPTLKSAKEMGYLDGDLEIEGSLPEVRDFHLPTLTQLTFGPGFIQGFMRRHVLQRPVCDHDLCRMCDKCWSFCPARAITNDSEAISFDYTQCIRCYCCVEVCPYGAIHAAIPFAGHLLRKIMP